MKHKRVGIAMSGGVDSAACALLLKDHYDIEGFFMRLAQPDIARQEERVRDIAARIGIGLRIVDLQEPFEKKILAYFSRSYFDGLTPNPCMLCNAEIKFGLLLEAMTASGMDGIATGHYARIRQEHGTSRLCKGRAPDKDQSYFLARLTQAQLERAIFPLGEMTKEQTYALVEAHGFLDFRGSESQDVCFLGEEDVGGYLKRRLHGTDRPGPIVTTEGRRIGTHRGLFCYTVGQRRGLGLPDATPWYVIGLDTEGNSVVVGKQSELFVDHVRIGDIRWLQGWPELDAGYAVRLRSTHRGAEAQVERIDDDCARITFSVRQRAVTPGQFAVIYRGDEVIGSGVILQDRSRCRPAE